MIIDRHGVKIMRLIIRLTSLKDCIYDLKYHHKLQGFIYNLIRQTPYKKIHDIRKYKFFCFSNILPPTNIKENKERTLIISSPDIHFINFLKEEIEKIKNNCNEIGIGEMFFKIQDIKTIKPKITKNCSIITGTPIIIRIPKENYKKYGIESNYNYVYWRSKWPFEAFVKQLEENLIKKFISFYRLTTKDNELLKKQTLPLFQQFMFKKQVCNHLIIGGKEYKMFGSIWQFNFHYLNKKQQELLQFGLDTGFGERNSMGFGFVNMVI